MQSCWVEKRTEPRFPDLQSWTFTGKSHFRGENSYLITFKTKFQVNYWGIRKS